MKITTVVFDLDDTLYPEITYVYQGLEQVAKKIRAVLGDGTSVSVLKEEMIYLLETEGRGHIFDRILANRKLTDRLSVGELVEVYRSVRPSLILYSDAQSFLTACKEKGLKTGLITDGNAQVQHAKISALGLEQMLDMILATADLAEGIQKPDVRVFEYCLEKLGSRPEESVYIGDNPEKDFIGARKTGMNTIRICRTQGMCVTLQAKPGYEADRIINNLCEIEELL